MLVETGLPDQEPVAARVAVFRADALTDWINDADAIEPGNRVSAITPVDDSRLTGDGALRGADVVGKRNKHCK
jgi:hypothetical protein